MAPGGPIIDSNLLAQIQTLTNQLLSKTEAKSEPEGFNTVSKKAKKKICVVQVTRPSLNFYPLP